MGHSIFRRPTLIVMLGLATLGAWPNGAAASSPASPRRQLSPSVSHLPQVNRQAGRKPLLIQHASTPIPRAAVPRTTAIQPSAPSVGGTWTPMGPKPIIGSESCCTTNPVTPIATYGTVGGRVTSLATDPAAPAIVYAGTAGGGVWKSTDSGATWVSTSAGLAALAGADGASAIGALAIDPNNSLTIYAGTGEDNLSDSQAGWGILKSTDGGTTWTDIGSATFARQHIGGIAVDRANSQRVFAATDIGLFQSLDAGVSWTRVTIPNISNLSGQTAAQAATQIIQDPTIAGKFWVSVSDFCVHDAGDVFTWDGATTWSSPTAINFSGLASRIGLGVGPNGVAYFAAADCTTNGLADIEKTANGGASWTTIWTAGSPTVPFGLTDYFNAGGGGQGDYDNVVAVDPYDTSGNTVVFAGITMLVTRDGGGSFIDVAHPYNRGFVHPDFHAVQFTAAGGHFYTANDGGVWSTPDWGGVDTSTVSDQSHWTNLNATLGAVQFYSGTALDSSNVLGGTQDNGSPGSFNQAGNAPMPSWQEYLDGDGGNTAIDPTPNSSVIYAEVPQGDIFRGSNVKTVTATSPYDSFVEAGPCRSAFNSGDPACGDPTSFVGPFSMDPTNPSILVSGTNRVYLTRNGGGSGGPSAWTAISGNLTTGTANFAGRPDRLAVVSLGPSGIAGPIITGSLFGAVSYTPNGSAATPAWTNITGNLPQPSTNPTGNTYVFPNPWISGAVVNPGNPAEAWVTIGGINTSTVWHTLDAGAAGGTQWTAISRATIPNLAVNGIALDPTTSMPSAVYIATDTGVMVCNPCTGTAADAGATWNAVGTGLPNVKVNAISFTRDQQTLIAWTHGLGAWSIPASGWQKLGGKLVSRPFSTSLAAGRLDTFVLGSDNQIWHNWIDTTVVNPPLHWEVLPGQVTSDASVVSPTTGVYDAFARGTDMSLLHDHYQNGAWMGWNSFGGKLAAEPAATAGNGTLLVFVKGTDSQLWSWGNARPVTWQALGGVLGPGPSATFARTEWDAFVQGTDRKLWYWSSASGWHGAGGVLADKPVAISDAGGRIDAFVRGTDQALWHWSNATGGFTGAWEGVGGRLVNRPAAVTLGSPRLDAFVQGADNNLWHATSTGAGWQWEQLLGVSTTIDPAATVLGATRIDIFVRNTDLTLWHRNLP